MKAVGLQEYDIVREKEDLELLSWVHRDLRVYAIAAKRSGGGSKIVEEFRPAFGMRGNALRSLALQAFTERTAADYSEFWPIEATCAKEVKEGHVLVLETKSGPGNLYLITEVTPSVIFAVNADQREVPWTRRRLDVQIREGLLMVTSLDSLPDRFRLPLEEATSKAPDEESEEEILAAIEAVRRKPMGLRGRGDV